MSSLQDSHLDTPNTDDLAQEIGKASRRFELEDPDAGLPLAGRVVNRTAEILGVTVMVSMVGIIFFNALGRHLANAPIIWAEEVVTSLIPWLAVIGLFLAIRRRSLIRIEFFFNKLPPRVRPVLAVGIQLFGALVFGYLAWVGLQYVQLFGGDRTAYLGMPRGYFTASIAVGAAIAAVALLVEIRRDQRAKNN